MSDIIRVLRVIEYTGPKEILEKHLTKVVKGTKICHDGIVIKAATLGDFPEVLATIVEGEDNG